MPLPSFLQRFRSGAQTPAPQVQPLSPADIEQARIRARRRMIGMAVLVGVGVIGFPWLFETQPRPLGADIQVVNAAAPVTAAVPASPRQASGKVLQAPASMVVPPQVSRALDAERSAKVAERAEAAASPREEFVPDAPRPEPKAESRPVAKPEPAGNAGAVAMASKPDTGRKSAVPSKQAVQVVQAPRPVDKKPAAATPSAPKTEAKMASRDPAKEAKATESDTRYIVQVGAFADAATAHAARMKVERLGIKTYTQAVDTPGGKKIRVRVGPYTNKADADKAMATLRKAGLTGALLTL